MPLFMNVPPAGEGEEEWQKEFVNGSQNVMLKGLKGGLSYRVRLVAKGHQDQPLHCSKELVVKVPGEAVAGQMPPTLAFSWPGPVSCVECLSSLCPLYNYHQASMGLTDVLWSLCARHVVK